MGPSILNPSVGLGLFSFTVRKVRRYADLHCSPAVLVQSSRESDRCWSHATVLIPTAHPGSLCRAAGSETDAGHTRFSHALQLNAATLQEGLQSPVPRPVRALQANTLIYSNDSPAAKAGASTTLTVLVNNTDAPPSDLPLEGAHLHLLIMVHNV